MKHKVTCLSVFNPCTLFLYTAVAQSRHQCLLHVILSCWEMDSSHILCTGACHVMTLCSFHEMSGDVCELLRNSDCWRYVSTTVTTANPLDSLHMQIKREGHISAHTVLPAPNSYMCIMYKHTIIHTYSQHTLTPSSAHCLFFLHLSLVHTSWHCFHHSVLHITSTPSHSSPMADGPESPPMWMSTMMIVRKSREERITELEEKEEDYSLKRFAHCIFFSWWNYNIYSKPLSTSSIWNTLTR